MERIIQHFKNGFKEATEKRTSQRRVGAELKFPLVNENGEAVTNEDVKKLWDFLSKKGWHLNRDAVSGDVVGAAKPGPMNENIASCETGFCKVEFSLAHVADIHELKKMTKELRTLLREFSDETGKCFIGFGIQPVTPPGKHLLMKKGRNIFWDKVFGSNRHIAPEDGDDVHLFTVSASSQVHIDVSLEEAINAVNVFNGFSGAQLALTANSNIWKGKLDNEYRCVGEMFWDWWIPGTDRFGIPPKPFTDIKDYISTIAMLKPVYVKREGIPIGLLKYDSFYEYFNDRNPIGIDPDENEVVLKQEPADIDQHGTFYWYDARISRYYTLENRMNDQQPSEDIASIATLTLGIISALQESEEVINSYDWEDLRKVRIEACRNALNGRIDGVSLVDFSGQLLDVAEQGLKKRGLGEEQYLSSLKERLTARRCPADEAEEIYHKSGIPGLVEKRRI